MVHKPLSYESCHESTIEPRTRDSKDLRLLYPPPVKPSVAAEAYDGFLESLAANR